MQDRGARFGHMIALARAGGLLRVSDAKKVNTQELRPAKKATSTYNDNIIFPSFLTLRKASSPLPLNNISLPEEVVERRVNGLSK